VLLARFFDDPDLLTGPVYPLDVDFYTFVAEFDGSSVRFSPWLHYPSAGGARIDFSRVPDPCEWRVGNRSIKMQAARFDGERA
jgi:hypothetical protein